MVTSTIARRQTWGWIRPLLTAGVGLVIVFALAYWGGAARINALFFVGVGVLAALMLAFALVTWWLFFSPLPAAAAAPSAGARLPLVRQVVGVLGMIGGLLLMVGGIWDEAWHRLFGVGAAINDFFWPPHLMIYGSMALTALFAIGGMLLMLRGRGDIRERIRAEPLIGMLALASAYMAFSAPSDYLWHQIYGLDITGWSLPHILLTTAAALVMLTTVAILLAPVPLGQWRMLGRISGHEALAALMIGASTLPLSQAIFTEWDGIKVVGDPRMPAAFWQRPEWLYPVVVVAVAVFFSAFALHATRRAGFATLVMAITLGLRGVLLGLAGIWGTEAGDLLTAHLLMLAPALALDVWYALRLRTAESRATLAAGSLVAAAVFMAAGLPAIAATMVYPRVNAATAPGMILFGALAALWFGWVGARFGRWLGSLGGRAADASALDRRVVWAGLGALVVFAGLTVIYMLTAAPPTAF